MRIAFPSRAIFPAIAAFLFSTNGLSGQIARPASENVAAPVRLVAEYERNPIGLDVRWPRLGWQMPLSGRGEAQTAYEIEAAGSIDSLEENRDLRWETGRVPSGRSVQIPYAGRSLGPGERCYWRVRVWDEHGRASLWSRPGYFEMGLLQPADWTAQWLTYPWRDEESASPPAPYFRQDFRIDQSVRRARLYVTSLGLYEMELNGRRVGDGVLTPGWTDYDRRLRYQTYDVTKLLRQGGNAVGAILGDGWYRGTLMTRGRNVYGSRLALLAQLEIEYADGSRLTVASGPGWKASTGPILSAEIYNGEVYDARKEMSGWSETGFDDRHWAAAVPLVEKPTAKLEAQAGPLIRRNGEVRPIAILHTPAGEAIFDFGQNLVGWVRLKVRGPAGVTVRLKHAEMLDRKGDLYTGNLRGARDEVDYTLKGEGEETHVPYFTYQGFRYVRVEGYPGKPALDDLTGIVVHTDMEPTGRWESSNPLLNRLQQNIVWSQRGNFLAIPTDCPQRDERLGWTGDAQIFARTAAFNYDVAGFYTGWLRDVAGDQKADGAVPWVVPDVMSKDAPVLAPSAGWADVALIIPWTVYESYDDRRILERQYLSMKAWVEWMRSHCPDLIWRGPQFADWLAYTSSPREARNYPGATTGWDLVATAYFAYSTDLLAKTAAVLGRGDEARRYRQLFEDIRAAFNREFVTPAGRVGENTQTAYVLALRFDLLPENLRAQAAHRLAADIRLHHHHLTTGFLGTPYLCAVLSQYGELETAYTLLERETYPSWLYPVKMGATTVWERWDGVKPDGSFEDPSMNSFNHYAYGAIGEWMYRTSAGIDLDPVLPGYKHVLIQPRPGGDLSYVRASLKTPYGLVRSSWELQGDNLSVQVAIPANSWATVRLPAADLDKVQEGGRPVGQDAGLSAARQEGTDVVLRAEAGDYAFLYPSPVLAAKLRWGIRYGLDDTIGELLDRPETRAVLERLVPAFLAGPGRRPTIVDQSLLDAAPNSPQILTQAVLRRIESELRKIRK